MYPFVLDTMVAQGVIKSRAFSLDLRSVSEPTGAIIIVGLDTGRFVGELERLHILPTGSAPGGTDRYWVVLTGIGNTLPDGITDCSCEIEIPVFLDSGGTFSRLLTAIFQAFGESFPAALFDPENGFYIIDYDVGTGTVDFYFNTRRIAVAFTDFIW